MKIGALFFASLELTAGIAIFPTSESAEARAAVTQTDV